MTELLEKAYKKASSLPEHLQDIAAERLLQEIEWEEKWDKTLEENPETLKRLAERAQKQYQEGKTKEMGFDEL